MMIVFPKMHGVVEGQGNGQRLLLPLALRAVVIDEEPQADHARFLAQMEAWAKAASA